MLINHKPTKVLITGSSGTGKSTYFTRLVLNSTQDKIFVFDHEGEFSFRTGKEPCRRSEELGERLKEKYIVYDPSDEFPGDTANAFNFFCDYVFTVSEHLPGTKLFASDEMQKILGTDSLPYEFCCIVETGRRRGIDTVFIYQQCNLMHNRLRNQLTEIVTFRHIDKRALIFLEELCFDPEEIRRLARGEFRILDIETMRFDGGKFVWAGKTVDNNRDDDLDSSRARLDRGDESASGSEQSPDSDTDN